MEHKSSLPRLPQEMFSQIMSQLTLRDRMSLITVLPEAKEAAHDPSLDVTVGDDDLELTEGELEVLLNPAIKSFTVSLSEGQGTRKCFVKNQFLKNVEMALPQLEDLNLVNCAMAARGKHCNASSGSRPCFGSWFCFPRSLRSLTLKSCSLFDCHYCDEKGQDREPINVEKQSFYKLFDQE